MLKSESPPLTCSWRSELSLYRELCRGAQTALPGTASSLSSPPAHRVCLAQGNFHPGICGFPFSSPLFSSPTPYPTKKQILTFASDHSTGPRPFARPAEIYSAEDQPRALEDTSGSGAHSPGSSAEPREPLMTDRRPLVCCFIGAGNQGPT